MSWFRKKQTEADAHGAPDSIEAHDAPREPSRPVERTTDAPSGASQTVGPDEQQAGEGSSSAPKRRRGSRGGRGRKKSGTTGATGTPDAAATDGGGEAQNGKPAEPTESRRKRSSDGGKESSSRRSGGGSDRRRKQAPRRAPLPSAKRELLISIDVGEQRVAILEDDRVTEVYLERPERRSIAGNIYLGTVDNVLPGMEAAFVEIGLEKNGFLYVDEIVVPELEGKRHGKKIQDLISRGEKILVQAVKDPMKTKGARLTTEISLPGRFLVFVPNGEGLGVSRRLDDAERARLKDILKRIAPAEGGVIVRTAAEGASAEDVERDLVFLERLWKTIQAQAKTSTAPALVYREAELPLRIVRDLFAGDFAAAWVDNDRAMKRIAGYLKKTSPHMVERVQRWKEKDRLFERFGVEAEIASTLERRVDLPSGGYLIFDYAEAFTVVDVNTGRFVGSRSKTSTQRLEDTILKNNLEAVKEVVRQLRLRDIGGIIVIDFIDMANQKNREAVEEALRIELERDRTKTYVVEISPLGLVEMTRQNVTEGPREIMTRKCPACGGDGIVVSDATVALEVERKLRALAAAGAGSRIQAYRIAVNPRVLGLLAGAGGERLAALEEATRRRFFLVAAERHAHADHFRVLAEGRLEELQPTVAIEEGAQLEVKPVEIGEHDVTTAVAKLDGIDIVIADAAKLVGKKATVRVGRVLEGIAFATLVEGAAPPEPITFEAEAEKPTRAPVKRKGEVVADPAGGDAVADEVRVTETAGEDDDDVAEDEDGGDETGEAKPRRRRRGSRGGRGRRKPAATAEGDAGETGEASETGDDAGTSDEEPAADDAVIDDDGAPPAPKRAPRRRQARIHVPGEAAAPSTGDDTQRSTADAPATDSAESSGEPDDGAVADGGEPGAEAAKRKRRRGSRGGRGRRKPSGATTGENGAGDGVEGDPTDDVRPPAAVAKTDSAPAAETVTTPPAEAGYVPMSEWLDDFDRRG